MPYVTPRGITVPSGGDAPSHAAQFATLANTVDAAIGAVVPADSGWVNLTLASGWLAISGYTPQVRMVGKTVTVRGMARFVSGQYTDPICTIPLSYTPSVNCWLGATTSSVGSVHTLLIQTSGALGFTADYRAGNPPAANMVVPLLGVWLR